MNENIYNLTRKIGNMETEESNLMGNRKLGMGGSRSTKKAVRETLINWARKIPGFNELKNEDQVGIFKYFSLQNISKK